MVVTTIPVSKVPGSATAWILKGYGSSSFKILMVSKKKNAKDAVN